MRAHATERRRPFVRLSMPEDKLGCDFYKQVAPPHSRGPLRKRLRRNFRMMMLFWADQRFDRVDQSLEIALWQPRDRPELARLLNHLLLAGISGRYNRYTSEFGLLSNPPQNR